MAEQKQLYSVEALLGGHWLPVTFGHAIRLIVADMQEYETVKKKVVKQHETKGLKCPELRCRLMSEEETKDARQHLMGKGYKNCPNPSNVKAPEKGKIYTGGLHKS